MQTAKSNPVTLTRKNSVFIGQTFEVYKTDEVETVLKNLHTQHPKATHICYGYCLPNKERAFDDGEPAKTAGYPLLHALKANHLTCCLLVVVRYFGGIKLGTGGLVSAYQDCAKAVLTQSLKTTLACCDVVQFTFSYEKYHELLPELNTMPVQQVSFQEQVQVTVACNEQAMQKLSSYQPVVLEKNCWIKVE